MNVPLEAILENPKGVSLSAVPISNITLGLLFEKFSKAKGIRSLPILG